MVLTWRCIYLTMAIRCSWLPVFVNHRPAYFMRIDWNLLFLQTVSQIGIVSVLLWCFSAGAFTSRRTLCRVCRRKHADPNAVQTICHTMFHSASPNHDLKDNIFNYLKWELVQLAIRHAEIQFPLSIWKQLSGRTRGMLCYLVISEIGVCAWQYPTRNDETI